MEKFIKRISVNRTKEGKNMLEKLNKLLEKAMPFMTPLCVMCGILVGDELVGLKFLVPWIFAFMTFSGSLSSNFKQLNHVIHHPFPIIIAICMLHLIFPAWVWGISQLFFNGDPLTVTGLVLASVIPTGITSFIWVSIYKGSIPLVLTIILIDTLLSPIVVPASLSLIIGKSIAINSIDLMRDLLFMIVIPSIIGMVLNQLTSGKVKGTVGKRLAPFSKLCICVIVFINGGVISPYLQRIDGKLLLIIAVVFFITASGYFFSWFIARSLKMEKDVTVTMTFSGGMRNIAAGAVLAVTYFPGPVALPVIIGMLFQQVMASIYGRLLQRYLLKDDRQWKAA